MVNLFENFKLLRADMEDNGWIIEAFNFNYKKVNYVVLAKLYLKKEKKPKFALLKTEIINLDEKNKTIEFPVNSNQFIADPKTLREFFNIQYGENMKDIIQQFNLYFSKFIPHRVNSNKTYDLIKIMIDSLSKSDSENPNKIYCFTVKRNSNNAQRTIFNDNKSRLLKPSLYEKFKNDPTISFCYSNQINDEKTDEQILLNFSKR